MTKIMSASAFDTAILTDDAIRDVLHRGLEGFFSNQRVLVLMPDHTRTLPLPFLFREVVRILHDVKQLDFMVALGTHPPLDQDALCRLVGITKAERDTVFKHIGLLNHDWENPDALTQIGTLTKSHIQDIAGALWHPSLGDDTPVRINRYIFDYDHIVILGPTFPHEVVGFSGGAKYLFPGISGAEMINTSHWLGALATILNTIGIKDTPVRQMIHAATEFVDTPITLVSMVVVGDSLAGIFIGDHKEAWSAAANLSSQRHIQWVDKPFQKVLSTAPAMYDELWTAAKAMYKIEPAIADGGEVIIYAPHLDIVSHVHGEHIYEAGYHVRDYYLKQWDKFKHVPPGVLAHGTHLRGSGVFENGVEKARIAVTLATQISKKDCSRLALGYCDLSSIDINEWKDRENQDILFIPKAGEILYRLRGENSVI